MFYMTALTGQTVLRSISQNLGKQAQSSPGKPGDMPVRVLSVAEGEQSYGI